jgi:hypothetical protein
VSDPNEEKIRLTSLAHLKHGIPPKEVAELTGISYAKALKLRRQLEEAEENGTMFELFNLKDAARQVLFDSVKDKLLPIAESLDAEEALEGELIELNKEIEELGKLDETTQKAAIALVDKIASAAVLANNSDTLVNLADALCKVQLTFFGQGAHNPNGPVQGALGASDFEKYLRD